MKKALLLYNDRSGRGRIARKLEEISSIFLQGGYHLEPHPINFHENPFVGREEPDLVVVAGGDGTVNYAVNKLKEAGCDLPLGILPAGTANDFARALGMDRDVVKAARQIVQGEEQRIDCGRVNGLYFVNVFSFGIFTTTSQRTSDERKHRIGKLAYLIEGVKEFRSMHGVPLQVLADGRKFDLNSLMVLVFNGETAGGFHLARRASVCDGLFDVVMLEKRNFFLSTWAMGRYLLGGNPRIVHHLRVSNLRIESTLNEPTDVDGQPGAEFPLHVECLKGELRILCPSHHENRDVKQGAV
uniref:diacylglycerol/lipid kinase family protein n=1 Tax=Alistipes sp. TaxID=1872444 RepID=UPI004055B4C5